MNQQFKTPSRSPFQQLLILEERVRLSGSALPKVIDLRAQWAGVKTHFAGHDFILKLSDIAEILDKPRITPIPRCSKWVVGATNIRGQILPIYNVAEFFNLSNTANMNNCQVVVVDKSQQFCGFLVDKVFGMQKFFDEHFFEIQASESISNSAFAPFIVKATKNEGKNWELLNLLQLSKQISGMNPAILRKQSVVTQPDSK